MPTVFLAKRPESARWCKMVAPDMFVLDIMVVDKWHGFVKVVKILRDHGCSQ
jgi:hypothetical protein